MSAARLTRISCSIIGSIFLVYAIGFVSIAVTEESIVFETCAPQQHAAYTTKNWQIRVFVGITAMDIHITSLVYATSSLLVLHACFSEQPKSLLPFIFIHIHRVVEFFQFLFYLLCHFYDPSKSVTVGLVVPFLQTRPACVENGMLTLLKSTCIILFACLKIYIIWILFQYQSDLLENRMRDLRALRHVDAARREARNGGPPLPILPRQRVSTISLPDYNAAVNDPRFAKIKSMEDEILPKYESVESY